LLGNKKENVGRMIFMKILKPTLFGILIIIICGGMTPFANALEGSQKIVTFYQEVPWEEVRQYAAEWQALGVTTVMDLPLINALVLMVPDNITSDELADDTRVAAVEDDQTVRVKAQTESFIEPITKPHQNEYPWGILKLYDHPYSALLDSIDESFIPFNIIQALDYLSSRPVRIAVFDTGISPDRYIDIEGINIADPVITSNGKKMALEGVVVDDNGHGTHVAGVIAAALDKNFDWGKKAKVKLYSVKVLNDKATGDISNIIMGLQWAIFSDIDIVNMSIGYRKDSLALRLAIEEAYQAGLIMVGAVGNHSNYDPDVLLEGLANGGAGEGGAGEGGAGEGGAGEGGAGEGGAGEGGAGDSSINNELPLYSVMYPARYPEVISVGASTMDGNLASFSNYDETMDLMAPGKDIVSFDITNGSKKVAYGICSGTSMAAPHVTAAIAMMLAIDPSLTPDDVIQILMDTLDYSAGEPVGGLNVAVVLDAVKSRLLERSSDTYRYKETNYIYRDDLKMMMYSTDSILW
jgi:subtilisin family serine protease